MPFPYPEQVRAAQASQITERELPPSPMPMQALSSYVPNADARFAALANEVVNAQQPVPRTGGWIAPRAREVATRNPYYIDAGSSALYSRTGIPPVIRQSSPYATAGWGVDAGGSVTPLVGYPSAYPHVINLGFYDYTAPFMAAWSPYMYEGLQLMRAARAAQGGGLGGVSGRRSAGIRRGSSAAPAGTADIRTSNDRSYKDWPGPMSEEEAAIQHATQVGINDTLAQAPGLPEEPGLWQRDPNFSVPHYGGGTPVQVGAPSVATPQVPSVMPSGAGAWSNESFSPVSAAAAAAWGSSFTPAEMEPNAIAYPDSANRALSAMFRGNLNEYSRWGEAADAYTEELMRQLGYPESPIYGNGKFWPWDDAPKTAAPSQPVTQTAAPSRPVISPSVSSALNRAVAEGRASVVPSNPAISPVMNEALNRAVAEGQTAALPKLGPAIREVAPPMERTMNPGSTVEPQVVWPPAESRLRPVERPQVVQDVLLEMQRRDPFRYERLLSMPGAREAIGSLKDNDSLDMFMTNPEAYIEWFNSGGRM